MTGLASLFATCILDLEISRGSLIVDFCSCQLVTVDKKDMTKENCELPRNNHSQGLKTPMVEIETEAILATVT